MNLWGFLPHPLCEFCHCITRDSHGHVIACEFNYGEFHAICLGLLLSSEMWELIVRYGASTESSRLLTAETWYVGLGSTLRAIGSAALRVGVGAGAVLVLLKLLGVF